MIAVAGIDAFIAAPAGTYMADEHFLYSCENEELYAFYSWGKPLAEETRRLVRVLSAEMCPQAVPHRSYVDFSAVTGIFAAAA